MSEPRLTEKQIAELEAAMSLFPHSHEAGNLAAVGLAFRLAPALLAERRELRLALSRILTDGGLNSDNAEQARLALGEMGGE